MTWFNGVVARSVKKREESDPNTPIILGTVIGATAFLAISIGIIWFCLSARGRGNFDQSYPFAIRGNATTSSSSAELMRATESGTRPTPTTSITASQPSIWETRNPYAISSKKKKLATPPKSTISDPATAARSMPSVSQRQRSASVAAATEQSISSIVFAQLTERQMEVQERIDELQGKLSLLMKTLPKSGSGTGSTFGKMTHDYRLLQWKNRIAELEGFKESDWALGRTDIVPKGLYVGAFSDAQDDMRSVARPFR
ncbi:hypothetical protein VNI00_004249 [Paramarasmius palmivorus]|uniref:Uncharacterized protein n=1 Tax=Paramarasmius palmivorus TaxID=297713 RepID=A0AAW0DP18_9AGAR